MCISKDFMNKSGKKCTLKKSLNISYIITKIYNNIYFRIIINNFYFYIYNF